MIFRDIIPSGDEVKNKILSLKKVFLKKRSVEEKKSNAKNQSTATPVSYFLHVKGNSVRAARTREFAIIFGVAFFVLFVVTTIYLVMTGL